MWKVIYKEYDHGHQKEKIAHFRTQLAATNAVDFIKKGKYIILNSIKIEEV